MVVKVLYFSAEWCGPCKTQTPIIEDVMDEWDDEDDVTIEKANVDDEQTLANNYQVRSIPTVVVVVEENDDSTLHERFVGVTQQDAIDEAIQDALDA